MRRLGRSDLRVSAVGLGAWAWGASQIWGYGKTFGLKDVEQTWRAAIERGVNFVDTAMIYGLGESERIIGRLLQETEKEMVIATKYLPLHIMARSVRGAAEASMRRMGVREIDLYQVHFPNPVMSLRSTMREMERLVREGKVRHIGVSNFSVRRLEAARGHLSREDVVSNQVHYNIIRRKVERNGLVEHARREGVTIIAYSPIAQGILTGKYHPGRRPGGLRRFSPRFTKRSLRRVEPFLEVMEQVGRPDCTTKAQVALAWLLKDPNVVVIPGAKNPRQLNENAGASSCRMDPDAVRTLDGAYGRYLPGW